jgi:hypothetical protein
LSVLDGGLEHGDVFVRCFARMCGGGCPASLRPGARRAGRHEQNRYRQLAHGYALFLFETEASALGALNVQPRKVLTLTYHL